MKKYKKSEIEFDISSLKKKMRRFKIVSSLLVLATIITFAVFYYVFFSNDPKPNTVVWPEYDHTKPFNPYSDKNPNQSITVGDPAYDPGLIDNTNSPTPFPGWDQ